MKVLRIFTALLLVFLLLNYYTRKSLPFAHADVADYNLIYTTADNIYVKKLEVINDSLDILFGGKVKEVNQYTVWISGPDTSNLRFTGKTLRYKPPPSKSQTINVAINNDSDFHSLNVSYTPKEVYKKAGNASTISFEVTSNELAIEPAVVRNISDWVPANYLVDERMPVSEIQRYLRDSAGIINNESTAQKILKIGRLILAGMPDVKGLPSEKTNALHPLKLLEEAKAGRAKLWCGNYTAIFGCLATAAGIPNRIVSLGTSKQDLGLGNHAFNEAWLKEEKCWAYVDLTGNTVLLQHNNRYLNGIDLQRILRYPDLVGQAVSYTVSGDSISTITFTSKESRARYYFNQNTLFTFYYKDYFSNYSKAGYLQRIKNLFLTRPQYAVYSDNLTGRNYHFLARVISNYLLVMMGALWLIAFFAWVISKIKKRK
jgi:hypothetical protein